MIFLSTVVCSNFWLNFRIHERIPHVYYLIISRLFISDWEVWSGNRFWINTLWVYWWSMILCWLWYFQQILCFIHEGCCSISSASQSGFYSPTQSPWKWTRIPIFSLIWFSFFPGIRSAFSHNFISASIALNDVDHSYSKVFFRAGQLWG